MKKLLLFSALLLSACGSAPEETPEPIKIGYLGPLTGEAASYGIDTVNGVMMAIDEWNEAGGIDGQPLQLIAEDARCTGTDAANAVQKLVNIDGVVGVVGGQCSGETLAAAPIVEGAEVPMISPVSSSPDVTDAGEYVFRTYPSDALKTKAMAQYFRENDITKIAMITENTDFAVAFRNSLKEDFGVDAFVFDEVVEPGTKDYRSLLARLQDVEFDVFFPNGQTSTTIASMMVQLREQGFEQAAISHDVAQDTSLLEIAPEASEGMRAVGVPEIGEGTVFGEKIMQKFGGVQAAYVFVAHSYDAMNILADTIAAVGTDGPTMREHLAGLQNYEGVVGTFGFDKNGDVTGIPYVLYEVQDGKWEKVADIAVD